MGHRLPCNEQDMRVNKHPMLIRHLYSVPLPVSQNPFPFSHQSTFFHCPFSCQAFSCSKPHFPPYSITEWPKYPPLVHEGSDQQNKPTTVIFIPASEISESRAVCMPATWTPCIINSKLSYSTTLLSVGLTGTISVSSVYSVWQV